MARTRSPIFSWWRSRLICNRVTRDGSRRGLRMGPLMAVGMATDLATEHGGTDANKRDGASQRERLNLADVQL